MNVPFNPLVSIIINCFNGEKYLSQAIESILDQTYKNWEIIFWDNKSTDRSSEIFKSYNDKRLRYFYDNEHTPLYKARNLAVEKVKGDFISFLDTDDLWDKSKLELQMNYFINPEVGVVFSNLWILKNNEKKKRLLTNQNLPRGKIFNELVENYTIGILTTVIRKKYFLELENKFDERFSIIGDFDLFLRLSKLCVFESIQVPLASFRLHGKNLSNIKKAKEIEEYEIWLRENKCNLNSIDINKIKKKVNYRKFVNCKIDGNYGECIKMIINLKKNLFIIKYLIIFITPTFMLKKFMWWHQD